MGQTLENFELPVIEMLIGFHHKEHINPETMTGSPYGGPDGSGGFTFAVAGKNVHQAFFQPAAVIGYFVLGQNRPPSLNASTELKRGTFKLNQFNKAVW
jgi:hypothetical protein